MIKTLVIISVLALAFGQEYEIFDNLIDFEDVPYQRISLPYPYQDNIGTKVLKSPLKPLNKAIVRSKGFDVVELPAKLKVAQEVKTALSSVNTSVINTLCTVAAKFFGLAKTALSLVVINVPALILGAVVVIGFCKITSICTKINSIKSIGEMQKEFSAFITPDRLDTVSEFIQEAIRKYRSIQKK